MRNVLGKVGGWQQDHRRRVDQGAGGDGGGREDAAACSGRRLVWRGGSMAAGGVCAFGSVKDELEGGEAVQLDHFCSGEMLLRVG